MRVACLFIPDLPLAAALRAEPELRGKPLGIVESYRGGRGETIIAGELRGLTAAQGRAVKPDLVVRSLTLEGIQSAQEALLDVASSVSPRVEDAAPGIAYIDLDGTAALFPTERGLMTALEARARDVALETLQIGIGPTQTTALLAARHQGGGTLVGRDEMSRFLGSLPLDLLDPPEEVLDRLTRWGVRTLGELASISKRALGTRLGEAGVHLARRARGEDLSPFRPSPPRLRFEEGIDPGYAVGNLEALAFQMRRVLDRLTRRLRVRGLAVRRLYIELGLESGKRHERGVELAAPTLEVAVLTSLVRLALEKAPPDEPVQRIRAIAAPGCVETAQLDLFLLPLPAPAELGVTVARLGALCGPEKVGAPGCNDTHRLDEAHMEAFTTDPTGVSTLQDSSVLPRPTMALRAFRPPRPVRVWEGGGLPERVALGERALRILARAGPWRLFGEWWGESCFARDYFDVELSDGGVYRMYRNLRDESWFVDGIYD
jgi:protein ImuB